jgi:plasmid stabilization system protein ParE
MPLVFHPRVQSDINAIVQYYEFQGGTSLADRFFDEFEKTILLIHEQPTRFHYFRDDVRRANLETFPYHILYRVVLGVVRILVVRHGAKRPMNKIYRR